jgi:hypothetical protein
VEGRHEDGRGELTVQQRRPRWRETGAETATAEASLALDAQTAEDAVRKAKSEKHGPRVLT